MNAFDSKLLDGKTKLHFVGIGGSGMFPLVQILHEVGYEITGSDVNEGDIIDRERKLGIPISMGHKAENVHGAELVVYTAAIMRGNRRSKRPTGWVSPPWTQHPSGLCGPTPTPIPSASRAHTEKPPPRL